MFLNIHGPRKPGPLPRGRGRTPLLAGQGLVNFGGPRGSTYNDGKSERSGANCPARTQFSHSGRVPGSLGPFQARVCAGGFWPLKYPHKTSLRNVPESPRDLARSHVLGKLRPRGFVLRALLWHLCLVSTMQPCRPVAFRPRLSKWHSRCADAKKRQGAPG